MDIVTLALLDACQELGVARGRQADHIATACLDALKTFEHPLPTDEIAYDVIVRLPHSAPARTFASELLAAPQAPLDAITQAYADDPDVIADVVESSTPRTRPCPLRPAEPSTHS